jgi:hypothetical protein
MDKQRASKILMMLLTLFWSAQTLAAVICPLRCAVEMPQYAEQGHPGRSCHERQATSPVATNRYACQDRQHESDSPIPRGFEFSSPLTASTAVPVAANSHPAIGLTEDTSVSPSPPHGQFLVLRV